MIINDLDGYYIVFDTKNWNTELDTLANSSPNDILSPEEWAIWFSVSMIVASGRIKVVPFFFSSSIFSETFSYVTKALLGPQVSFPDTLSQT